MQRGTLGGAGTTHWQAPVATSHVPGIRRDLIQRVSSLGLLLFVLVKCLLTKPETLTQYIFQCSFNIKTTLCERYVFCWVNTDDSL